MTDLTALDELIKSVEAGINPGHIDFFGPIDSLNDAGDLGLTARNAYNGSIGAAKALHDALVPEWVLERLTIWPGTNGGCSAVLLGTHEQGSERWHSFNDGRIEACDACPVRAWLLAVLRAYRAQIGGAA